MATVTIAGTDFTTYAALAEADEYMLASFDYPTWTAKSDDDKGRYLVSATRLLDAQTWQSTYDTFAEREAVADIVNASIEIASMFAKGETAFYGAEASSGQQKRAKADTVEVEYFRNFATLDVRKSTDFPPYIFGLLRPYLASSTSIGAGAFSAGTDGVSIANNDYDLIV
jgi:hypothetical protein